MEFLVLPPAIPSIIDNGWIVPNVDHHLDRSQFGTAFKMTEASDPFSLSFLHN
jgi:hypothetical protein